ncbi:MAG: asparagine synthase (glutamine-hydrolyzing) [Defluviitaleaceae bacterium]|nr:asparagine synthase (glutamine-hydrolyzing) [Defluviitaleaceae bacterium]
MSGIGGLIGYGGNTLTAATVCESMLTSLKKRGQDEHGTFISQDVCLLHTRTNAVNTGRGPLRGMLGQKAYVLAFDGELYNKEELIRELRTLGYRLQDNTDAAVVLHGYMAWGESCLDRFLGMYAFAIWDSERLFMARDRLGLKPFFYSVGSHGFVFASDIKTLLCHPQIQPVISLEGIAELLLLGPGRTPGVSVFRDIRELKPGYWATYSKTQGLTMGSYWQLRARPHRETFEETAAQVRNLLKDAVARQSVTPKNIGLGTFLSGGLDSSIVASLSSCKETFSVDYFGNDKHFSPTEFQPEDDNEFINIMVKALGGRHRRIVLGSDELADALTPAMEARGLPGMGDVDAALLLFCRQVKESVPIALSGEGADEIFGGYPWYQQEERLWAKTFPWSQSTEYRCRFIAPHILNKFDPEAYIRTRYEKTLAAADTLYDDEPTEKRIRQMFLLNIHWFLQNLATRNETMSTAAGLIVRSPFLDHRLVEYLYNVPWTYKNHQDREKGLLREAVKGLLPASVLARKKSPFPKTHNPAYMNMVTDMIKVVLQDDASPLFEIVPKNALVNLLTEETSQPWYGQLMTAPQTIAYFLQINAWMKEYGVLVRH